MRNDHLRKSSTRLDAATPGEGSTGGVSQTTHQASWTVFLCSQRVAFMQIKVSDFINQGSVSLAPNSRISLLGHQEKDSSFSLNRTGWSGVHQHIAHPKVQCELFHSILRQGAPSGTRASSCCFPLSYFLMVSMEHSKWLARTQRRTGRLFDSRRTEPQESSSSQLGVTLPHPPASLDLNSRRTIYKNLLLGLAVHTYNFYIFSWGSKFKSELPQKYKKRKMRREGKK